MITRPVSLTAFEPCLRIAYRECPCAEMPNARRKTLGALRGMVDPVLLSELLRRVAFTTVSGELDNLTDPGALYRRCGFTGEDVWWVLRC